MLNIVLFVVVFLFINVKLAIQDYVPSGYVGCYSDMRHNRTLEHFAGVSETNSGGQCKLHCSNSGYRYAGTEYGRYCFCGNEIKTGRLLETGCDRLCPGSQIEHCGGSWQISVYDTGTSSTSSSKLVASFTATEKKTQMLKTTPYVLTTTKSTSLGAYTSSTSSTKLVASFTAAEKKAQMLKTTPYVLTTTKSTSLGKDDKRTIVVIITVPLAISLALIACVIIFCFFKRKSKKKQQHLTIYSKGRASVPSVDAVCAEEPRSYEICQASTARYNAPKKELVGSTETLETYASDDTYNSIQRRLQKLSQTESVNSYDHLKGSQQLFVDQTYSHTLQEAKDGYEIHPYVNCFVHGQAVQFSANCLNTDSSYNKLQLRRLLTAPSETKNNTAESLEESEYDHTSTIERQTRQHFAADSDYSHLSVAVV